jgi:hypothetical protein
MTKKILALSSLLTGSLLAGSVPAPTTSNAPVAPAPAAASALSYNNLEIGWLHSEWDFVNLNSSDGAYASLSYSPLDHFYLTAGGGWESVDLRDESTDLWIANGGVGAYLPVGGGFDLVGEGGVSFYGFSNSPLGDDNDASAYFRPHVRGRWGNFEVQAGASWTNLDISNEWAGFGRFYLGIMDNVDLSAGISAGKDEYTLNVGLRFRY